MQKALNRLFQINIRIYVFGLTIMFAMLLAHCSGGHVSFVKVVSDSTGHKLTVDDTDFFVNGMNWDYYPIGTNYKYVLWEQSDEFIRKVLEREMGALKEIGVNSIRQYVGVPPKWVRYIYENYDIFTILNHPLGRYGVEVDGKWVAHVNYADTATREVILQEIIDMVEDFRYVPGVLMWLLGNENNYGLIWESSQTQDMPEARARDRQPAKSFYSLVDEAARLLHIRDNRRPVALANGDTQFIDLIVQETPNLDIFGANVYRGSSFEDLFQEVKDQLGLPFLLTEFGADAYHATEMREDEESQARYLLDNWFEIHANTQGLSGTNNVLGGCTFQFTDGWWKSGPDDKLDIHDTQASWSNGGYGEDFIAGENNMNEEWFGVCAKGPTDAEGMYELLPRIAYDILQQVHTLNPLAPGLTEEDLHEHYATIRTSTFSRETVADSTHSDTITP